MDTITIVRMLLLLLLLCKSTIKEMKPFVMCGTDELSSRAHAFDCLVPAFGDVVKQQAPTPQPSASYPFVLPFAIRLKFLGCKVSPVASHTLCYLIIFIF